MRVTPGVRLDVYASRGAALLAIDPRISASFAVHKRVTLEHTFGIARQPPSFVVPIPGFQLSDLEDGLQRSLQSSAGVIVRPGRSWQLNATAFHNVFLNLTDSLGSELARDDAELTGDRQNEARLARARPGLRPRAQRAPPAHRAPCRLLRVHPLALDPQLRRSQSRRCLRPPALVVARRGRLISAGAGAPGAPHRLFRHARRARRRTAPLRQRAGRFRQIRQRQRQRHQQRRARHPPARQVRPRAPPSFASTCASRRTG